jgi:hypothetical protein
MVYVLDPPRGPLDFLLRQKALADRRGPATLEAPGGTWRVAPGLYAYD